MNYAPCQYVGADWGALLPAIMKQVSSEAPGLVQSWLDADQVSKQYKGTAQALQAERDKLKLERQARELLAQKYGSEADKYRTALMGFGGMVAIGIVGIIVLRSVKRRRRR